MSEHDAFGGILASLHDAMLDDARWPATSALIDEACGLTGNDLIVREGPLDDVRVLFVGAYCRGQRREDQERDYLENYYPTDERVPRFRLLPDSRVVHVRNLLTADDLKTSPTYNDMLLRTGGQDSLNARLDGPDGSSHHLGPPRPRRRRRLGVVTGHDGHGPAPPHPAVRSRPTCAGPRGSAPHDRDRPARQPADRHPPPGPARADPGGQ